MKVKGAPDFRGIRATLPPPDRVNARQRRLASGQGCQPGTGCPYGSCDFQSPDFRPGNPPRDDKQHLTTAPFCDKISCGPGAAVFRQVYCAHPARLGMRDTVSKVACIAAGDRAGINPPPYPTAPAKPGFQPHLWGAVP